jgi:hypothetical protein
VASLVLTVTFLIAWYGAAPQETRRPGCLEYKYKRKRATN